MNIYWSEPSDDGNPENIIIGTDYSRINNVDVNFDFYMGFF